MKQQKTITFLIILLVLIGIGYAVIRSGLNINGTTHVMNASWDIHFENYQVTANSNVTPTTAPDTSSNTTRVSYEVTLTNPGDIYEFTIDAVNNGTIDAMIESFSSKLNNTEITSSNLPGYLEYSVTYDDGISLANKQALVHGTTEKIRLRVKYRDDISTSVLPQTSQDLTFNFEMTYVQDDGTSISIGPNANFTTDSWTDIVIAYNRGTTTNLQQAMAAGTTRAVPLDLNLDGTSDTTCNLRIANLSTPAECKTAGFSQTACGLVLECANVISWHKTNSTRINTGGWPATEMRTYLNDDTPGVASVYNALPSELRSKIIPTFEVSGHGYDDTSNFTSVDRIYLFSPMEIWGYNSSSELDSARDLSRQLDFYHIKGVDETVYYGVSSKKGSDNEPHYWWLRTPVSDRSGFYAVSLGGSDFYTVSDENMAVSPAFRIG